jgi:hypothetical protein
MTTQPAIYRFTGAFAYLSNFHRSPIEWAGFTWPTVEHAFQAAKCSDFNDAMRVLECETPGLAKRKGRESAKVANWQDIKVSVMNNLIRIKFAEGTPLAFKLLATHGYQLIEGNTWGDKFWGVVNNGHGDGENHLGRLLMAWRDELHAKQFDDKR